MSVIPINTTVNVNISLQASPVSQKNFGTPLIFGKTQNAWNPRIREYFALADILTDGFASSDPEYKAAAAIFAQDVTPVSVKIAQQAARVAQVSTITWDINFVAGNTINGKVNGVALTPVPFNVNNATTLAALTTAIDALAAVSATDNGVHVNTVTATPAGIAFTLSNFVVTGGANQAVATIATSTPNHGIAEDIAEIQLIDDDWYGLIFTDRTVGAVLGAAAYIQGQTKLFVTVSDDSGVLSAGSTTDLAYLVKASAYTRTAVIYNADATKFADAAYLGVELPKDPGSYTMNLKTLNGIPVDNLTATQYNAALAKFANTIVEKGGNNVVEHGTVGKGLFTDEIRFIDWLTARIEEGVFFVLLNTEKVPYTNDGVQLLKNEINAVLLRGVAAGGLSNDPAPKVTAPKVADQSANDRAARYFPGIKFTAVLSGAIHKVDINGVVTS